VKTMKDVIKATTPTTPKTITWAPVDTSHLTPMCSNVLAFRFRMANRRGGR
jgi:hypothetical protein